MSASSGENPANGKLTPPTPTPQSTPSKAKFNIEPAPTHIIQIVAQFDNAHEMVLGLGLDGKVYLWDKMYGQWQFYQPNGYQITQRNTTA